MLQIDPVQFLYQAAALAVWTLLAAAVYAMLERAISGLNVHDTSLLTAYTVWFFMGMLGAHRIFCQHIYSGMAQLLLTFVLFLASLAFGYYFLFAIPPLLWWLFDATQIPGWVKAQETRAATAPIAS
jgi:hypothetical protein